MSMEEQIECARADAEDNTAVLLGDIKRAINNGADRFYDHEETDFTIDEVLDSIFAEVKKVDPVGPSPGPERVARLVDKFLAWPLPESVCADLCATRHGAPHRSGTNLLSAIEARQMIEYLLKSESV